MNEILFKKTSSLRFWCQHVLPLVYDDSLSYYELLCKVVEKINILIENSNKLPDFVVDMIKEEIENVENLEEIIKEVIKELLDVEYYTKAEIDSLFVELKNTIDTEFDEYYNKTQVDGKDTDTLNSAKDYTDSKFAEIPAIPENIITEENGFMKHAANGHRVYIDCVNGDDNNDGTAEHPIRTMEKFFNECNSVKNGQADVRCYLTTAGRYDVPAEIHTFNGMSMHISAQTANVELRFLTAKDVKFYATHVSMYGLNDSAKLKITAPNSTGFAPDGCSFSFHFIDFTELSTYNIYASTGTIIDCSCPNITIDNSYVYSNRSTFGNIIGTNTNVQLRNAVCKDITITGGSIYAPYLTFKTINLINCKGEINNGVITNTDRAKTAITLESSVVTMGGSWQNADLSSDGLDNSYIYVASSTLHYLSTLRNNGGGKYAYAIRGYASNVYCEHTDIANFNNRTVYGLSGKDPQPDLVINSADGSYTLLSKNNTPYNSGESFTGGIKYEVCGIVTTNATKLYASIPVARSLSNVTGVVLDEVIGGFRCTKDTVQTITVNKGQPNEFQFDVHRLSWGYLLGKGDTTNWTTDSDVTVSATKVNDNLLRLEIACPGGFDCVNNSAVTGVISVKFTTV